MTKFTIAKNGKNSFTMTEKDFIFHCHTLESAIRAKIGDPDGRLPEQIDGAELMMLNEFDELLEHYFTLKFFCREYGFDMPDETDGTANLIADLIRLLENQKKD